MKTTFTFRLPLALVLVLVGTLATLAQTQLAHRFGSAQPLRREVRAYVEATVLPVLRQQRQKLETQLAPADQAQLVTYRAQLKELKAQGQALRQSLALATSGTHPTLTEAQKQQVHALRLQGKTIMLSVAQLALKYDTNIQKLSQEIALQKEQWAVDIKAIVTKNATPEQQQKFARWQGDAGQHNSLRKLFRPAAFLLLDPNGPAKTAASPAGTSLYPNPAVAITQLQVEVKEAGPVAVDLLDASGTKLRTLLPEVQQDKGTYTRALDLSELPKGTYFYKITTKSGTETKRFVKE
jgi:hypothetical protein